MPKRKDQLAEDGRDIVARVHAEVVDRINVFCEKYLDPEYAEIGKSVADALLWVKPCPFLKSSPAAWTAGIIYTAGWVNFLSDPAQKPHMKPDDLFRALGVSSATTHARSSDIRKLFGLTRMDPRLCRASLLNDNPMAWLVQLSNGMIDDARRYPRSVQEQLVEAGVIPYVHPDAVDDVGADAAGNDDWDDEGAPQHRNGGPRNAT